MVQTTGTTSDSDGRYQRQAHHHPHKRDEVNTSTAGELRLQQRRKAPSQSGSHNDADRHQLHACPACDESNDLKWSSIQRDTETDLRGALRHDVAQRAKEPDTRKRQANGSNETTHERRNPRRQQCRVDRFGHRCYSHNGHAGIYSLNGASCRVG